MSQHPVRFGIQTPQQQAQWTDLRGLWQKADLWGYDSLWVFDHFYPIMGADPAGPCMEGWTALSALSQQTRRARIGALVNGNTYRNPCITAKMAATLDHLSAGRFVLGIGAGWYELEHDSFGVDFKTVGWRLQALDEACQIIKGMFTEDKFTLHGKRYSVSDAVCSPKPIQKPHPPLMVAGTGEKVLLKIVARYADLWNAGGSAERMGHLIAVLKRHCDSIGRDSAEIEKTMITSLCYRASAEREKEVTARAAAMSRGTPAEARKNVLIGGADECLETIERYGKVGVTHFIFSMTPPYMEDEIQGFAEEVIPKVRRT
ncbi:MAG TPA: TIGR03560 family F420-dependent LLM class oxidoreductase [Candidatus Binataceae bacterium]|nr:TIGR03560 family F420-dependent LLM class oxidoreductase [Candidatus Binataceae bacterium]